MENQKNYFFFFLWIKKGHLPLREMPFIFYALNSFITFFLQDIP